jgi:hypothetical protein
MGLRSQRTNFLHALLHETLTSWSNFIYFKIKTRHTTYTLWCINNHIISMANSEKWCVSTFCYIWNESAVSKCSNGWNALNSGFRRDVDEICALLGYCAASCGNCLPTFRDSVSVPSSQGKSPSGAAKDSVLVWKCPGHFSPWTWGHYAISKSGGTQNFSLGRGADPEAVYNIRLILKI